MVDINFAINIFKDSIDKDFHLDNRTTYAREPISNILRGKNIKNIKHPHFIKYYTIADESIPEPKDPDPQYSFAYYLDRMINDGTIDSQSGVGFLIESLKFNFNTVVFWGGMPAPHVPYPYAFMYQDDGWVEVEPKEEGLFCLYESKIFNFEQNLRRELIDSKKERSDWKKYLTDTKIRSIL
ncbi:MAG: hypothetical protein KAS90_00935, partial [Candidatus Aenigmarchaeota archaeon]|nr:hypothetical protein [Candidatus Aenigmarchaeota archaeon]